MRFNYYKTNQSVVLDGTLTVSKVYPFKMTVEMPPRQPKPVSDSSYRMLVHESLILQTNLFFQPLISYSIRWPPTESYHMSQRLPMAHELPLLRPNQWMRLFMLQQNKGIRSHYSKEKPFPVESCDQLALS